MKRFIKKAIIFAIGALIICMGIELYLLTISNEYSYKRWYLEEQGDKIKVLILGHSHAEHGIIPKNLGDSVFNAAISARNVYYDAIIAEKYIPRLKNLKCVIWPLGYNFQYMSYKYRLWRKNNAVMGNTSTYRCMYTKYMDISYEDEFHYLYWSELINSSFDYCNRIRNQSDFKKTHPRDSTGYVEKLLANRASDWEYRSPPIIVEYNHPNTEKAFKHSLSYMKRIAQVCKEAHVRFIVITTPCYKEYVEKTTTRGMQEMQYCVDAMKGVYPSMEYYNYMSDTRFEDDDFFNSSHLCDVGAKKFSCILKEEVLKNWTLTEY